MVYLFFNGEIKIMQFLKIVIKVKKNCAELYKSGQRNSGVYTIDPDGSGAFDVFCDQKAAGGGWTVIQKRLDGSVDFQRGWNDYKRGFGSLNGEFWLGLDKMNRLTTTKSRLRVELEDTKGITAYAEYDSFGVASERALYKMSLGSYYGELMMINYSERHQTEKRVSMVKRGTQTCSLFCNIAAKQIGTEAMLLVLLPTFKPVLQKLRLLKFAESCCRK